MAEVFDLATIHPPLSFKRAGRVCDPFCFIRSHARQRLVGDALKEPKIRVNAMSPGIIPTPGYNTSLGMTQEQVDHFVQSSIGNVWPLPRQGDNDMQPIGFQPY